MEASPERSAVSGSPPAPSPHLPWPLSFGAKKPCCRKCGANAVLLVRYYLLTNYPAVRAVTLCGILRCRVCGTEWAHAFRRSGK